MERQGSSDRERFISQVHPPMEGTARGAASVMEVPASVDAGEEVQATARIRRRSCRIALNDDYSAANSETIGSLRGDWAYFMGILDGVMPMYCGSMVAYATSLVPDIDYDEVRQGQAITLLAGLSIVSATRLLLFIFI
jgi:hypothetical protein